MKQRPLASPEVISTLQLTDKMAGLDAASKKFLRHREILAIILRDTVEEFAGYTANEIMQYIEMDTLTQTEVSPDRTNSVIHGEATEFAELNEKTTQFDTLFKARNPKLTTQEVVVNLHVNIEPQKDYRPGYPIEKRGFYYLARSLSSQLSLVTEKTDYDQLEKCYSIWICRDRIPRDEQCSISFYKTINYRNVGECHSREDDYDLMQLVIIRLGEKDYEELPHDVRKLLTAIFYQHKKNFRKTIEEFIDMEHCKELKEEVEEMSGLGESVYQEGLGEGIRALIIDNLEEGKDKQVIIAKLIKRFQLSEEQAQQYWEECVKEG